MRDTVFSPSFGNRPSQLVGRDQVLTALLDGLLTIRPPRPIRDDDAREDLDALSFTRGMPSLGLELLPTELRCGPLVVPGRSACYRCYDRRRRQHGYRPLPAEVVAEHGPLEQAYARHHVLLGAGLISLALQTLDRPEAAGTDDAEAGGVDAVKSSAEPAELPQIGGQVWTIDLVSGVTACSRTVAVDRCETCSGRYEGRRDGLPALAALLPERREEVA